MRFTERCDFSGDPGEIWRRVSNLEAIPTYWHGTREFRPKRVGDKVTAEVVFAFGGRARANVVVDDERRTLQIEYYEGAFKGLQTVEVLDGVVQATWDVSFKGVYRLLGSFNESHFRSGTRNALRRICAK